MKMKPFLLDGEPISSTDLCRAAEAINERFASDWLKQTSVAATILRDDGHTVEANPDFELPAL